MANPLSIAQPSLVLAQSVLTYGIYPQFYENPGYGTAAVLGTIITTAFDPKNIQALTPAMGQLLPLNSAVQNEALYSILANNYGGVPSASFGMPNLGGASIVGNMPSGPGSQPIGTIVGSVGNTVNLTQQQMPAMLGGTVEPVPTEQYGQKLQYIIQVNGQYPTDSPATPETVGTIYAYAGDKIPSGFMLAAGQTLSIEQYPLLASVMGVAYGGNGRTTFSLPDLRNMVPIGAGDQYYLGQVAGSSDVSLYPWTVPSSPGAETADYPIPTMQPSLAVHFIINTEGAYNFVSDGVATLGQVIMYAGAYVPEGWMLAHGQELSIRDYSMLYQLIGTQFGGDGINTFALPDLRNRIIIGSGGSDNLAIGDVVGQATVFVTQDNLPDIIVSVPGVSLSDDTGASAQDHVTNQFAVNVSGVWPAAQVEFSSDGLTWSAKYTAQEGKNSLYVRQIDVLGQASAASHALMFTLDSTAPVTPSILIDGFAERYALVESEVPQSSSGSLTLQGIEPEALVQYSMDGGVSWSEHFQAVEGRNAVSTRQVDRAGNVSESSAPYIFDYTGSSDGLAKVVVETESTGAVNVFVQQAGVMTAGLGSSLADTVHFSLQQSLNLPSDLENAMLSGIGAANVVTGNELDNQFTVLEGSWHLDGQGGFDTLKLDHDLDAYLVQQSEINGNLQVTLIGPEGKLVLSSVDQIQFTDGALVQVDNQDLQDLYHLYATLLGRTPDFEGLDYWTHDLEHLGAISKVADSFIVSDEFKNRHGQSLTSLEFIDLAYQTLLGRDPDQPGQDYWKAQLDYGKDSRGDLWLSIMLSKEGLSFSSSNPGVWIPASVALEMS